MTDLEEIFGGHEGLKPHAVYGPNHGVKDLPDNRAAVVIPRTFGAAQLVVGEANASFFEDMW